ncbi:MAG: hypothetical protein AMXMBFR23_20050 [Chloroflexota bacterium]
MRYLHLARVPALALALLLVACEAEPSRGTAADAEPSPTVTPAPDGPDGPAYGIAGLVPPHHPAPQEADYLAFFEALEGLGGWVGTYVAWTPEEGVPEAVRTQPEVGRRYGYRTLPIVGFHRDVAGGVALTVDFADPAQVDAYTDALVDLVQTLQPPFLGVGNEVNRIWEDDPAGYEAWVRALPGITDAVRAASPDTRVFVTFQYEFLRGAGAISGEAREPQWALLDGVRDALDLIAFTTYPYFDFGTPDAIPADYYAEAAARAGTPVAFTEVGWPSAPLAVATASPLGGTPEEQAAFIERLSLLLDGVEPAFVMWVWAYDSPATGPLFESLGLSTNDGTPKPALDAWRRFLGVR